MIDFRCENALVILFGRVPGDGQRTVRHEIGTNYIQLNILPEEISQQARTNAGGDAIHSTVAVRPCRNRIGIC